MPPKIIESRWVKLVNMAEAMQSEAKDKTGEESRELNKEVLCNKNCVQNMAQMLMSSDDPDVLGRAHVAMDEANRAANRSCYRMKGL